MTFRSSWRGVLQWSTNFEKWAPAVQKTSSSWTRIDRLAVGDLVRIDRNEFDMAMLVHLKLAERSQLADLTAHFVKRERPAQRLELARHGGTSAPPRLTPS